MDVVLSMAWTSPGSTRVRVSNKRRHNPRIVQRRNVRRQLVTSSINLWNGIGGFRGRLRLGNSGLFIPYYFDAGAGASKLTWQIASGLGYHMGWGDVSLTYRYLTFEQNNSATLQRLSIYGPMIMVNFTF